MMDSETVSFIRKEIARSINLIFSGTAGATTTHTEDIQEYLPGAATLPDRPIMQPYGFASRAAANTLQVVVQQGSHPANLVVLGHRDKDKPSDLAEGESAQYSSGKYQVRVLKGKIQVGKNGVWETVVVGETLEELLKALIQLIADHQHIGNLGFLTGKPMTEADFLQLKANFLDNDKILSKDGGRF